MSDLLRSQSEDARQADHTATPPPPSLRDRAIKGSAWTIGEYLVSYVLRFGSNLILAHALFPEAFALVAYAAIVLQGLQMFSDIGIGPAIVQSPRGSDPNFLNTAWTIQALRGLALFLLTLLLGWPVAMFYNEPQLVWIVPACGLNFITTGLQSTAMHTCSRLLILGRLTVLGLIEAVLKAVITIAWALLWPSVWALIGGAFISYGVGLILTHTILPGIRNRFCWDREAVRTLMHFGGWVSLSTMFTFIAGQLDRLILGKLVSMGVVGVYSIALMFARLPYEICSRLTQIVLFPTLAAVARQDRNTLHAKFIESRELILAVSQFGLLLVIIGAPWFFEFFYDPRYNKAAFFTPLLACTIWFTILQASADRALLAIGDARALATSNGINFFVTIVGCITGYLFDEMRGFILGVGAGNLAGHLFISWSLSRRQLSIIAQDIRYTGMIAASTLFVLSPSVISSSLDTLGWRIAFTLAGILISAIYCYMRVETLVKYALSKLLRKTNSG